MPGKFPFKDQKNTAAITCRYVMKENQPILYASHDADDGMRQFLCGAARELDEAIIAALEKIYEQDHFIAAVAKLPPGYMADKADENSKWSMRPK